MGDILGSRWLDANSLFGAREGKGQSWQRYLFKEWPRAGNLSLEHCRALQPARSWQTEDLAFDVTLGRIPLYGGLQEGRRREEREIFLP